MNASARIKRVKLALFDALKFGGEAYANGRSASGKGFVDQHFTAGNQQRYGWQPLSEDYFRTKQGLKVKGTKSDKFAQYKTGTGSASERNLPMLVKTGALRAAVGSKSHMVVVDPKGNVLIIFRDLPEYALYLHEGTDKMPKRSPVEPNAADRLLFAQSVRAYLDKRTGTLI